MALALLISGPRPIYILVEPSCAQKSSGKTSNLMALLRARIGKLPVTARLCRALPSPDVSLEACLVLNHAAHGSDSNLTAWRKRAVERL